MTNSGKANWTSHGAGDRPVSHAAPIGGGSGLHGEAALSLSSPKKPGLGRSVFAPGSGSSADSELDIPPLPGSKGGGSGKSSWFNFDPSKSVSDLLSDSALKGRFTSSSTVSDSNDAYRLKDRLSAGETPRISISYKDSSADAPKADFIVKKDGTIEVLNNPEKNPDRDIVIQVEGSKEDTKRSAEQQDSIDGLAQYMSERIKTNADYASLSGGKFELDDMHKMLSDKALPKPEELKVPELPAAPPVPEAIQDISNQMNGIRNGGGSGTFDGRQISDASGRREVPPAFDELPPVQAMKETLAAMFKPDEKEPYKTVRHENTGYRVGRYGMGGRSAGNWLGMMLAMDPELAAILGDPPDYSKLQEYLKKHPDKAKALQNKMAAAQKQGMEKLEGDEKVPKGFASKFDDPEFSKGFSEFIGKLGDSNTPQEEISAGMDKFLPKELQETMNQQLIETYAKQIVADKNPDHLTPEDAGKIGIAMHLGRVPTDQELQNPNYKNYREATQNFYQLARAGQFGDGFITVSEHNQKLVAISRNNVGEALWAQTQWSGMVEGGNLGCAASVSRVLQEMGVRVPGSASVVELSNQLAAAGYDRIPISRMNQYRPGDIVYGATGGGSGGNGHIGIIGEVMNGQVWQYDNSSSSGQWTHHTVQAGGSFVPGGRFGPGELFVMRRRGG